MVTGIDIGIVIAALLAVLVSGWLVRLLRPLLVNTVLGLGTFLLAGVIGINVSVSALALALVVLGGIPGALAVVFLSALDIAFVPASLVAF